MVGRWVFAVALTMAMAGAARAEPGAAYIDAHAHLFGDVGRGETDYPGAVELAVRTMDALGIRKTLVMPPPFAPSHPQSYDVETLNRAIAKHPDRFAVLGGGGTLNPMLAAAAGSTTVDDALKARFTEAAHAVLDQGAVGFGEMMAEHFSMGPDHPYLSAPADHPLLLLADIAALRDAPIDIHMEAIEHEAGPPEGRYRSPPNPSRLTPNSEAFERLLAHNPKARIVWAHLGWDNTGQRTPDLTRRLLAKHPNLYVHFKMGGDSLPVNQPLVKGQGLGAEWLELIKEFPDRFMIGSDQFFVTPRAQKRFPQHTKPMRMLMNQLPPDLARRVGVENVRRVYTLGDEDAPS
ncbi:MAG: amidohydrolase family protein [Alphaproteobacteria bacterium]|nr:amidohydrolase family protein [Alphaproteobacteria bacterium]